MPSPDMQDSALIPWDVRPVHRNSYHFMMLRIEAVIRAGLEVADIHRRRHASWLQEILELNAVVLYDPDTPDGFYLVPRLRDDDDLVRPPA